MTGDGTDTPGQSYDLYLREGTGGIVWRLRDHGIAPGSEALDYRVDGRPVTRPYDSIGTITLSSGAIGRSGILAQCIITFRGGARLTLSTANAAGLPDGSRVAPFRDFVLDFHRRLVASGADQRITFIRGMSSGRHGVLVVAIGAAALLFVALPALLALLTGEVKLLLACVAGLGLVVPAWRVADRNRPGGYNPAHPPDLMA